MIELTIETFLSNYGHAWAFGQKENWPENSRVLTNIMGVTTEAPVYHRGRASRDLSYELGGTQTWVRFEMSRLFYFSGSLVARRLAHYTPLGF